MSDQTDEWTVQILTPAGSRLLPTAENGSGEGPIRQHSGPVAARGAQVVDASVETLKSNWRETIQKLTAIGDGIDDDSVSWAVSQIEVGLTLGAKGQLLFIAEASAEASVKITLSRRTA